MKIHTTKQLLLISGGYLATIFLSYSSFWAQRTIVNTHIAETFGTPASISIIESSYFLPSLFFSFLGGVAADSKNSHRVLLFLLVGFLTVQLSIAILIMYGINNLIILSIMTFILGTIGSIRNPILSVLMKGIATKETLNWMISGSMLSFNLARVLIPPVAVAILFYLSIYNALIFSALLNIPMILYVLSINKRMKKSPILESKKDTTDNSTSIPWFILFNIFIFYLFSNLIWTVLPEISLSLGVDAKTSYGSGYSSFGIGAGLSALIFPKIYNYLNTSGTMSVSSFLYSLAYLGLLSGNFYVILTTLFFAGVGMTWFGSSISAHFLGKFEGNAGRLMSYAMMLMNGGLAVGSLFLSFLATSLASRSIILTSAIALIFFSSYIYIIERKIYPQI